MKFKYFNQSLTAGLLAALVTFFVQLTASVSAADYSAANPLKVALVLHGSLGDKSFFDSAAAGLAQAEADMPVAVNIIELGLDRSKWEPGLTDAADSDYDVVIAGTFEMTGFMVELAEQYPEVKFINFDSSPDYSSCECSNILAVEYGTSTAGYLAGYAAAKVSKTGVLGTIIGAVFPTITDFKVGFDQGALAADADVKIVNAVSGTFSDPAKGKEIALAQLNQGADVIFPISGATGIGALQAAKDAGILAVGVDSDQAAIFADTDLAQAEVILTSVEKKVGESLYIALAGTLDGSQLYGQRVLLGLQDGAVGISKNQWYEAIVPAAVRAEIDELESKIISGEITVDSDME